MKVKEAHKKLWVLLTKSGDVKSAYCSCTAGFSKCNHVIATPCKVQFAIERGCNFNFKSNYTLQTRKVKEISSVCEKRNSFDPCAPRHTAFEENGQAQHFFDKLEHISSLKLWYVLP